uniref:Uncharacterized protein n=1 Tax=Candidatus Kentrum sp. DK TaxID=2126562 RepID=A0A450S6Q2_9GAMM|nr:MAG: hypothetical protein BECKDK2373C_GA0170839_101856 [Candidatus Kentron sp. DK]
MGIVRTPGKFREKAAEEGGLIGFLSGPNPEGGEGQDPCADTDFSRSFFRTKSNWLPFRRGKA